MGKMSDKEKENIILKAVEAIQESINQIQVKIDRIREFYSEEIPPEVPILKKSDVPKIEEISNVTDVGNFTSSAGNVTNISDKNVTEAINITDIGYVKNMKGKNYIEEILSSTEMLIIIFVLLAVVFAAAIATRIWNRWRKAKLNEEDRRLVYLYSWY